MQTDEYLQVAKDSAARSKMVARTQHGSSKKFAQGVHLRREDPKERRGSIRRTYYTGIVQTFAVDSLQKSSHPSWQETCIAQLLKHHQSIRIGWIQYRNEIEAGQKGPKEKYSTSPPASQSQLSCCSPSWRTANSSASRRGAPIAGIH